jgi:PRTRC genetic system protein A
MLGYLSDPRDRALCSLTPTLMAPRFGVLDAPPIGQHRYIIGSNGLFLQARTHALDVCVKVADTGPLPYGTVEPYVRMARAPLPRQMFESMRDKAVAACPNEWAGVVVFDPALDGYRLVEPEVQSVSAGHISYSTDSYDDEHLVLDIHSHGTGGAFFSRTDDDSDRGGIYLAAVLGRCAERDTVTVKTRIVVNGQYFEVPWTVWA